MKRRTNINHRKLRDLKRGKGTAIGSDLKFIPAEEENLELFPELIPEVVPVKKIPVGKSPRAILRNLQELDEATDKTYIPSAQDVENILNGKAKMMAVTDLGIETR